MDNESHDYDDLDLDEDKLAARTRHGPSRAAM